jgi:hypothetical protein
VAAAAADDAGPTFEGEVREKDGEMREISRVTTPLWRASAIASPTTSSFAYKRAQSRCLREDA